MSAPTRPTPVPLPARRGHRFFAWAYDRLSGAAEAGPLGDLRRELVGGAGGTVVDLGSGTGHNLAALPAAVTELHLVEPDPHMVTRLARRMPAAAHLHEVGAEALPLATGSADTVITTLTMCSVDDLDAVAREAYRVLRPGGRLLVLEHVRSADPRTAARQDRLDRLWGRLAGGCHVNRDTAAGLARAGFDTSALRRVTLPGPSISNEVVTGTLLR
ncbi:class I SAM-dependent methyltransferase [Geodermatophilus sp. SYSU D00758]